MRLTETRLRRAFVDVLTALLATAAYGCGGGGGDIGQGASSGSSGGSSGASSSGGSSGTTSSSSGGSSGGAGVFTSACTSPTISFLKGLTASPPLDGAVQRSESAYKTLTSSSYPGGVSNPDDGDDGWIGRNGETVGSLCASATNKNACLEKVNGFRVLPPTREACNAQYGTSAGYDGFSCTTSYILYTRGDEVGVARSKDETRALVTPFDTLEEGMWAATNAGYSRSCNQTGPNADPSSEFRVASDGGFDLKLLQWENCGDATFAVTVHVDPAGNVTELSRENLNKKPSCAVAGRRPDGLCLDPIAQMRGARLGSDSDSGSNNTNPVGEHFAAMATLEAASVVAFRRLHRQLASFGAPRELLDRVRKAARDEVRHARRVSALARKYGVMPSKPKIDAVAHAPSLMTIALENAREGCVRETYGALVAHLQVTRAQDPEVRAAMAAIADEETEHAALSWDIAAWIEPQLGDEERAQLARERREAFMTLARDLRDDAPNARVRNVSGVPTSDEAIRMLVGLEPIMLSQEQERAA